MSSFDILIVKQFNEEKVEIFGTKEKLLFNTTQICDMLDITNSLDYVDDDLKILRNREDRSEIFVTEEGLYQILFMNNTPKTKTFRKWTTYLINDIKKTTQNQLEQLRAQVREREIEGEALLKKYEEIKKTGCNYTLQTDSLEFLKNGMSKHVDSKSRVSAHQTSNEKYIEVLHEFQTSCPALLEKCVHYCLEMYRSNGGREFFGCKLDHIKNIVEIIGHVLDSCRSSFEDISREELIQIILEKLEFIYKRETQAVNIKKTEDEIAHWVTENVIYEKGSYLIMSELYIRWFNNAKVGNKEKSKFRSDFEKHLEKFKSVNPSFIVHMREGIYNPVVKTFKGWRDIRLIS